MCTLFILTNEHGNDWIQKSISMDTDFFWAIIPIWVEIENMIADWIYIVYLITDNLSNRILFRIGYIRIP